MGSDSEAIALIPLWIVIASAVASFFSVVITAFFAGRSKKAEREADAIAAVAERENDALVRKAEAEIREQEKQNEYARQDEVARRVAAAQQEAAAAAQMQIHKLNDLKEVADTTHLLVNSNMMKEMRKGLVSDKGQLVLLQRVIALSEKSDLDADPSDLAYVKVLKQEIVDGEKSLKELEVRTKKAAAVVDA